MRKFFNPIVFLTLITVVSSLLLWFVFWRGLGDRMLTVWANYDGPNYLVVAKTWYRPLLIRQAFTLPIPLEYFPAHLPGYPLVIYLLNTFISGPWAMLIASLVCTVLAVIAFYKVLVKYNLSSNPFWLSILFLFLPARWLAVRTVGAAEPLFLFAILASFYFFKEKRYWLAGLFGMLAQITKSPALLLFVGYVVYEIFESVKNKKINWKALPLLLMPIGLLGVFGLYKMQTGDFLAYFHSGDNFHLFFPPFQSFVTGKNWLGDFWLEDIVYVYLFGALTVVMLYKQKLYDMFTFALVFFLATLFVAHRDLSRYCLPLMPFALIAFSPYLVKKEFKVVFAVILVPIYLYAINFVLHNTAPIADWAPYF